MPQANYADYNRVLEEALERGYKTSRPGLDVAARVGRMDSGGVHRVAAVELSPHNHGQPQFADWRDAHRHWRLTDQFLKS